jgi:hypothetical protein
MQITAVTSRLTHAWYLYTSGTLATEVDKSARGGRNMGGLWAHPTSFSQVF